MKHSVNDLVVNQFSRSLIALKGMLGKAREHAEGRKFDENTFLQMRLAPDMFPFVKQVQITTDTAKFAASRLSGKAAPTFNDDETTLAQLIERVDKTLTYLRTFNATDFEGYASKKASFGWKPGVSLSGEDYLSSHAIPNFYFHMATTYCLLRASGVNVGKGDFLGEQNWKSE